jgi:hypothetical protein
MKLLLSLIVAVSCVGANAATKGTKNKKHKINIVKVGDVKRLDVTDSYFGPVAVGRISAMTWQVELVGLTVSDPNSTSMPLRKVKAVLDISPLITDPMDPGYADSLEEANMILSSFFETKSGFRTDSGGGPRPFYDSTQPVAKVVSISFNDADVAVDTVNCLGLDLEVANQTTPADKECYRVRPLEIFEHAL